MNLDSQSQFDLKTALSNAFQNYADLRQYILDKCGKDLNQVTSQNVGMSEVYDKLIAWADEFWLDLLLDSLTTHNSNLLRARARQLKKALAAERMIDFQRAIQDPLNTLFLARGECFIGREIFRSQLKDMRSDTGVRVLMVSGTKTCGKSYGFRLLRMLDKIDANNIVIKIDFREFREGELARRYQEIVSHINTRLGVPYDEILPHLEADTRWFEHAVRRFDSVVRGRRQKLWLVFDHIRSEQGVEASIADALARLVKYAIDDTAELRIVLIDMNPADLQLEPVFKNRIEKDTASLPNTRADIVGFFKKAREAKAAPIDVAELESAASDVLAALAAYAPEELAYSLPKETWRQAVRLNLC